MNHFTINFRFRETLSVRVEDKVDEMSEDDDGSEVLDGSVVSSVTDKYGFMAGEMGDNIMERTKVDLEIVRRREAKWVEMLSSWDTYMMRFVQGLVKGEKFCVRYLDFYIQHGESTSTASQLTSSASQKSKDLNKV